MADPDQSPPNDGSSNVQVNYIIVPLLLILIIIVAILLMKYQTWCAWKFFKPKVTKQEEPVQISHLSMLRVSSPPIDQSKLQSKETPIVLELSNSAETRRSSSSRSWISKFKSSKDSQQDMIGSILDEDEENVVTILESNAIVYSGTPPSYGQSHLDV